MNEYFVYALVDPRNGSIFYIGKGKNDRPKQHLVESLRYKNDTKNAINPYKTRKILNILNAGYDSYDILYLHKNLTEKQAKELKTKISQITKERIKALGGQSWTREITDEQLYFIMIFMEYGAYSWYLLEKRTGLTKKIITKICKQYNIAINVIKLTAGNFDEYYGEDAEQHRYNKSVCHRGKLNGRYKDGKMCKSYDNPARRQ